MLRKNNIVLFRLLLIPTYFTFLIIFIGLQVGSIEWFSAISFISLNIISAWLLSYERNMIINCLGSLFFIEYGWDWFSIVFDPPIGIPSAISWKYTAYLGVIFLLVGILVPGYVMWKKNAIEKRR